MHSGRGANALLPNIAKAAKLGVREHGLIDQDVHTSLTVYGDGKNHVGTERGAGKKYAPETYIRPQKM
jgi:hypothetical protein